jgi:type I restriction enzyme M protein
VRAPYVSKIFKLQDFCYTTITVERPLRESKEATAKCTELFKAFIDDARRNGVIESSEIASDLLKVFAAILRLGRFADGQEALALVKKAKSKWSAEESVAIAPKIFELALEAQVWNKAWTLVEELDPAGDIIKDKKGNPLADSSLRDTENVPLSRNIEEYFKTEVLPHASDAWIDPEKSKVGYEIPFTRNFYEFEAIRSSAEIDAELVDLSNEIMTLLAGVSK